MPRPPPAFSSAALALPRRGCPHDGDLGRRKSSTNFSSVATRSVRSGPSARRTPRRSKPGRRCRGRQPRAALEARKTATAARGPFLRNSGPERARVRRPVRVRRPGLRASSSLLSSVRSTRSIIRPLALGGRRVVVRVRDLERRIGFTGRSVAALVVGRRTAARPSAAVVAER